jgi:alkylated DNA repair dioxygenase AlkB
MRSCRNILPHAGEALYFERFFDKEESDGYYTSLQREIPWKQEPIRIFGKEVLQPRLTASFADAGISYGYSGIRLGSLPWTKTLAEIKKRVEEVSASEFNTALVNLYRHGNDSMGWHRDDEKELGAEPVIASVSFGSSRIFRLREYRIKSPVISIELHHGDLLIMTGASQHHWQHQVPKTAKVQGPRINITFRAVKDLI